ncbi:hypothetical protein QMO46_08410 [Microbacterium barkeri]|uniref:hypothetical protein n=1 Tax=Microbacterium barkeri TaxID=33917 RepID=UPI0024AFB8BA|nr:hypothetical protein [Microbacterium barkeri]MDI6943517.1 hypothetical protein [Microbacterium barkeri]
MLTRAWTIALAMLAAGQALVIAPGDVEAVPVCAAPNAWISCPDNEEDHVELEGERHIPQAPPPQQQNPQQEYEYIDYGDNGLPQVPGQQEERVPCRLENWPEARDQCRVEKPPAEEDPEPEAPVIPPLTERDVLTFAPAPPSVTTEPAGIAIVGMPMNVVAPAQEHVAGGSLFGLPVTVTFTPASFAFDFGDGTVQTVGSGGSTWNDLGLPEFSATETSHAYAARGSYGVVVSVSYSAVVDFGVWGVYPVDGLVTATSAGSPVRVVEAHTALVEGSCVENPAGPGC